MTQPITKQFVEKAYEALALIENPNTWCKRVIARDALDMEVLATDATAVRWCSLGAMYKTGILHRGSALYDNPLIQALENALPPRSYISDDDNVPSFNDRNKHSVVVAWWRRAVGWLEACYEAQLQEGKRGKANTARSAPGKHVAGPARDPADCAV